VNGEMTIDRSNPSRSTIGEIKVDISKLESTKYPTATFKTERLEGLPTAPYVDGAELKFKITFEATAKIVNGVLTGTAVARLNMTDFGFDPLSTLGILKAENAVELVMTIEANRQP
jgi:hypothetical protein